jgi:hypothetical protein
MSRISRAAARAARSRHSVARARNRSESPATTSAYARSPRGTSRRASIVRAIFALGQSNEQTDGFVACDGSTGRGRRPFGNGFDRKDRNSRRPFRSLAFAGDAVALGDRLARERCSPRKEFRIAPRT